MNKKIGYVLCGLSLASMFLITSCERKIYKITFNENGGTEVSDIEIPVNEIPVMPENPTKEGHTFIDWYYDANLTYQFDANKKIEGDITLYAKWSISSYQITFETFGGTSLTAKSFEYGSEIALTDIPEKTGYEFTGWYTDAAITEEFTLETMPANDIKLYAGWDAIDYKVTFISDDVAINELTQTVEYGQKAVLPTEPTKEGYTFAGWFKGENAYNFDSTISGDLSLTAKWTINTYDLVFNKNNGEPNFTVEYNYSAPLSSIENPTKTGYVFLGWYIGEEKFDFDNAYMPAKDLTVTAKWQAGTYGIEYRRNNSAALGSINNTVATYDADAIIANNAYTLTGYTFTGWNSKADGTGTSYTEGQTVKNLVDSGIYTLYAQWTANTYVVKYDANNGAGTMADQTFTYDVAASLSTNAFTRTGYTFEGWATSSNGGVVYGNEDSVSNLLTSGSTTLYAVWSANSYAIKFDANNGEGTMADLAMTYDVAKSLPTSTFAKEGYTFAGWNTASDGTGTTYTSNASVSNLATQGSITLYAQWSINSYNFTIYYNGEADSEQISVTYGQLINATEKALEAQQAEDFDEWRTYPGNQTFTFASMTMPAEDVVIYLVRKDQVTITFDTKGGSNVAPLQGYVGDSFVAPTAVPTKVGYEFAGWYTSSSYEQAFNFENATMPEGGLIIHAKWDANSYTVEFNSNGGEGNMASQTNRYYEDGVALTANTFTKPGYKFAGWATEANGEVAYADASTGTLTSVDNATVTLYAVWTANTYKVAFDKNDEKATGTMANLSNVTVDQNVILPTVAFSKDGYKFAGWYTNSALTGSSYENNASVSNLILEDNATVTLYAKWTPITYTVTFSGDSIGDIAPISAIYDSSFDLPAVADRNGYEFLGWATSEDGEAIYDDKETLINLTNVDSKSINLFAKWRQIVYTVSFHDANGKTILTLEKTYDQTVDSTEYQSYREEYSKVGHTFNGWSTSNNQDIILSGSISLTINSNYELYPVYTANSYKAQFIIGGKIVYETEEKPYGEVVKFDDYLAELDLRVQLTKGVEKAIEDQFAILFACHLKEDYSSETFIGSLMTVQGILNSAEMSQVVAISSKYYTNNTINVIYSQTKGNVDGMLNALFGGDYGTYGALIPSIFDLLPKLYSALDTMAEDFAVESQTYKNNNNNPYKENSVFGGWKLGTETAYVEGGSDFLNKMPASTNASSNVVKIVASWAEIPALTINSSKDSLDISWTAVDPTIYGENAEVYYEIYHHTDSKNVLLLTVKDNKYTLNTDASNKNEPFFASGTYQLFVIAVVEVKDANGNVTAKVVSNMPETYASVSVALKESNLEVSLEGDYYKKGIEDGMETFYFYTETTYEFGATNSFTLTDRDGNPASYDFVTIDTSAGEGFNNNIIKIAPLSADTDTYFYFTNTNPNSEGIVYYAKVNPYISQFDLGANLQQFNKELTTKKDPDKNKSYLKDYTEVEEDKCYQVGVNVLTNTTELENNGFKFDLTVRSTGGKSIAYTGYADYLVYKFEEYNPVEKTYTEVANIRNSEDWSNPNKPWESTIGSYDPTTGAWNFLSSNVGKIYRVTIAVNDNYVPPILSNREYGNGKHGTGIISAKQFHIQLNDGINVFSHSDFKKAFADISLKGGLNIHANIIPELDPSQFYNFNDNINNPLENYWAFDSFPSRPDAELQGSIINQKSQQIIHHSADSNSISGNIYQRTSMQVLNDEYVINGNFFTIDGSGLDVYANIYSVGDLSPLADYKIPDTKITIIGYFVSPNAENGTLTNENKLTVNDLTIISNAGNIGKEFDSENKSAIDRLNTYSGGYHAFYVSSGATVTIDNVVVQNANIAILAEYGIRLNVDYLHTMSNWYNSIFIKDCLELNVTNSYLKDSGGAAIHVADNASTPDNHVGRLNISSSTKIENFVSGEEAYFKVSSMEIMVMQMKTQFDGALNMLTSPDFGATMPGTHKLIQYQEDLVTGLGYEKINFAFLCMPVDNNAKGEGTKDATAHTQIALNLGSTDPNVGLINSSTFNGSVDYIDYTSINSAGMPSLVGSNYNGSNYETVYLVLSNTIPGLGNCVFGSIGYLQ